MNNGAIDLDWCDEDEIDEFVARFLQRTKWKHYSSSLYSHPESKFTRRHSRVKVISLSEQKPIEISRSLLLLDDRFADS